MKTEDFSQVISQSESPSVTRGPTLVSWGWTTNQDTNKGFTGSKSHIFNFSRSLGVKTVSVLVHKKIGLCWKSAAADLCNGRWMGSACDPGLEAVCFKARGSNYVVLN